MNDVNWVREHRGHRNGHGLTTSLLAVLFVLLPMLGAQAAVSSVQAEVSSNSIDVGSTFLYQVTVTGSGTLPTPTVNLPSSFQIVSGPNSNMSMQFTNGKMSSTRTLTYRLRAMRKGSFVITAPIVREKREEIKGNDVSITVSTPDDKSKQGQSSSKSRQNTSTRSTIRTNPVKKSEPLPSIFLKAEVNSQQVHFQEPIVLTFTLYFQPNVNTFNVNRLASTEGFWSEEWKVPNPPDVVQEFVNGQAYNAAKIHRVILFPTKTGELTIGPMELTVQYRTARRSRSVFDSFFDDPFFGGGSVQHEDISSDPITIKVLPLPDEGRPVDFNNVVGDYRIRAQMDADTVRTNESVSFKVTVSGQGNVGFIPTPEVSFPSDLEVYEPQVNEDHHVENGQITGEKSFTWLLLPRRPGKQAIPSVSLSYFDPKAKKYQTRQTAARTLQVLPATGWSGVDTETSGAPSRVETLGQDIRWILPADRGLRRHGPPLQENPLYWLAYLIPAGVVVAGFGLRKRQHTLLAQAGLIRSRKAAKRAMEALAAARTSLSSGNVEEGYTGLARGLVGYIADRIAVPAGQLDRQRLTQELAGRGISESSVKELTSILDLCDSARFTPMGADPTALADLIERSQRWIGQVDRSLDPHRSSQ